MLLRVDHETKLSYSEPVAETVIELRMGPPSNDDQTVLHHQVKPTPNVPVTGYRDGFGNRVNLLNVYAPHTALNIHATSFVQTHRRPGRDRLAAVAWPPEPPALEALEYTLPSSLAGRSAELTAFVAGLPPLAGSLADAVEQLWAAAHAALTYEKKATDSTTNLAAALTLGKGVCQDFTHLFLGACRTLGLPARYVSGYILQPGEIATHAWVQVWGGPALGWIDVDPTRRRWVEAEHVVTAVGRDYADVPPNRGVWKGNATETMSVSVAVWAVDRIPADSADLGSLPVWTHGGGLTQTQSQAGGLRWSGVRQFRQQQSQQQQTA